MSVYFVTGKLGSGKSLVAVGRIRDYLNQGRRVATNLNICPDRMVPSKNKGVITRLPDKPRREDYDAMGEGHDGAYDEDRFGLLVLDELGSWMNSRTWNDKERLQALDWFLHARKHQWDIMFIVQDIDIIDKQLRGTLCEFLVVCRRTDRLPLPLIGPIAKLLTSKRLNLPKVHTAKVFYGDTESSMKVDRWWYRGRDLYDAYETRQVFTDQKDIIGDQLVDMRASYSVLSAWHTRGRYLNVLQQNALKMYLTIALFLLVVPALWIAAKLQNTSMIELAKKERMITPKKMSLREKRAHTALAYYREWCN